MTARADPRDCECICGACGRLFTVAKPSRRRRYCGHACAFTVIGEKVRAAAIAPAAIAKRSDARRGSGASGGYVKRNGRHEHRVVVEETIGRRLTSEEIVHHRDEIKSNNAPENLEITNRPDHGRHHNLGRKREPKRTCRRGHALEGDNLKITSIGRRACLICFRQYDREWKKQRRRLAKGEIA